MSKQYTQAESEAMALRIAELESENEKLTKVLELLALQSLKGTGLI